jgi:hypothetical protein
MLEPICDERRDPNRVRGLQHISEIVPIVLAKIITVKAQLATECHPKVKHSPSHIMPTPGALTEM